MFSWYLLDILFHYEMVYLSPPIHVSQLGSVLNCYTCVVLVITSLCDYRLLCFCLFTARSSDVLPLTVLCQPCSAKFAYFMDFCSSQHCLHCSAFGWFTFVKNESLPFVLHPSASCARLRWVLL